MQNLYSPIDVYPFLQQLCPLKQIESDHYYVSTLKKLLNTKKNQLEYDENQPKEYLFSREKKFHDVTAQFFKNETKKIAKASLVAEHSFEILGKNTHLMDSVIRIAFDYIIEDLPVLKHIQITEMKKEYAHKSRVLPEKGEKLVILQQHLESIDTGEQGDEISQMKSYYQNIYHELETEISEYRQKLNHLEKHLELLEDWEMEPSKIFDCLIIFARGGYGRGELSFSSDRDMGYCLNPHRLNIGEIELVKQFIIHIEHLLNQSGIETAHQYFEIDEDLSRFTQPEMLHTIPSILESRLLIGNPELMDRLKQQFYEILPYESYVLNKLTSYREARHPEINKMDLKLDFGGLRTLQIPLWIASATYAVFPSNTAELLALLIEKRILSPQQTLQLAQALELYYDLRNFIGGVKEFYFDKEAESNGCHLENWEANVISDDIEKLYLLKSKRFNGFDEFDRLRLRMVYSVQKLSKHILDRLLERTIVRAFSKFQVSVHLGEQKIQEIRAIEGLPQIPLTHIFNNPVMLLDFFIYIGNSGYDLSDDLKDGMTDVIKNLTPEVIQSNRSQISKRFTKIMLSPHVAKALRTMFEIYDPSNSAQKIDTLLGRFIPECNEMRFLLRNLNYHQHTVCEHTLLALDRTQIELESLKKNYTELYNYLTDHHILALRWGMLFHDIGKIDPKTKHQVSGTATAIKALERLGYEDEDLFNLVSLLIYHHMTVVALSRDSTYFDQALQRFFEAGDRDIVRLILLFLINISDYYAVSDTTAKDTKKIRQFFDETYRAYTEIRMTAGSKEPLDLINLYLDNKKRDLKESTRINLLIHRSLNDDLKTTLLDPLAKINAKEYERLLVVKNELQSCWKILKLGTLDNKGIDEYTEKLIHTITQYVSPPTVKTLTMEMEQQFNWFFTSFPNRFLLAQNPDVLAKKIIEFADYENQSIFSVMTTPRGYTTGILIYVHDQPDIILRIAYGMSMKNIDIAMGKMNKVVYEDGRSGYCYYFEISGSKKVILPKELRQTVLEASLPILRREKLSNALFKSRLRLEFLESDNKGYEVLQKDGQFVREDRNYYVVKITTEDAPLLFYKITEAFEQVNVPIQQAVITTTGLQVNDYFYVTEKDYFKLIQSKFEEILKLRFAESAA